jgi:hypothetical protein
VEAIFVGGASEDVALDQLITRFRALGLPLTPVYLTFLFSVYEQDPSFRPTSTASLVEKFVKKVLGKSTSDLSSGSFDYENSVSLLAYLAGRMIVEDNYVVVHTDIYRWADQYLRDIELKQNIHELVSKYIKSGIFSVTDGGVQFRHDMFLAYFVAQRMISNQKCFDLITVFAALDASMRE